MVSPTSPVSALSSSTGDIVLPRARSPRSAATPIFPHISQDPVHRRRRRGALVVVLLLVAAITAGVAGLVWAERQSWTAAPTLVNLTANEASQVARSNELSLTTEEQFSETVPKGRVISTTPEEGTRVKRGTSLNAIVSKGPERYAMPTLTGLTLDAARGELSKLTLTTGSVTQTWHETVKAGLVTSTSQQPGTALKRGTAVDLVVSRGPRPIDIPSWVGRSATEARTALEKAGFTVRTSEQHSDAVAKGLVISQDPAKGQGKKGDSISLVASKGPVLVQVPRVVGADEATARDRLGRAGLKVAVVYNTPAWLRLNVVAGQDPAAQKMAVKGSTVTIFIS